MKTIIFIGIQLLLLSKDFCTTAPTTSTDGDTNQAAAVGQGTAVNNVTINLVPQNKRNGYNAVPPPPRNYYGGSSPYYYPSSGGYYYPSSGGYYYPSGYYGSQPGVYSVPQQQQQQTSSTVMATQNNNNNNNNQMLNGSG